jgi:putative ABC transport system ATP-binding protein
MLTLKNISKSFQTERIETIALSNINLHIKKGEFVSVMGPSGCGKSTLLNIMGLLDHPSEGNVAVDDQDIISYKDKHMASKAFISFMTCE